MLISVCFFEIRCLRSLLYPVNTVSIDCLWSSSSTKKKITEMENFYKKKKKKGKGCGRRKMGVVVEIMLTTPNTILFSIRTFLLFSLQISQQSSPVPPLLISVILINRLVFSFFTYYFFDSSIWFSCLLPNRPFNLYLKWNRESPVFFFEFPLILQFGFPCFWWKKKYWFLFFVS